MERVHAGRWHQGKKQMEGSVGQFRRQERRKAQRRRKKARAAGQEGGIGRYTLHFHTIKRRSITNLKTKHNQNCQKHTQTHSHGNQHQKGPIRLWVVGEVTENQQSGAKSIVPSRTPPLHTGSQRSHVGCPPW